MEKFILFLSIALSLSFLSFKDNPNVEYKNIGNNLIQRNDGTVYQKDIINLMFKNQVNTFGSQKFGIEKLDDLVSQFGVTRVRQIYPLKKDVSRRMIGDDNLARIFSFYYSGKIDPTDLSKLIFDSNNDLLEWVEPDFVYFQDFIPNDPSVGTQYHIAKINSYQAWDLTTGDTNVVIGIVDSGSDLDHPDLSANIKYNWADPINNIDDDNNGFVDDFAGWDFAMGDNDPQIYYANNDHGSHVSGCASQVTNNGVHGAGIGYKVKLRISKHAVDNVPSAIYNSNEGLVYCYQNGCKIINCSWGSSSYSSYTQTICTNAWNAGTVICASAGNGDPVGLETPRYPASYDNVVSVAATNSTDLKATFSHYHSTVDVCAPGDNILSTVYDNTYVYYSGTSMSAPITSGTVGLIRSKYPSWTPTQVVDRLKLGVDSIYNLNPTYIGKLGTGRVNAFKCVTDYPIISLISYSHNDSLYGNNDKVYDSDEKISLMVTYKNIWFTGSNVSLRLTTTDPNVEITKDSVYAGTLNEYMTYSTSISNTFEIKAKPTCPFDKTVTFRLRTSSNAYSNDNSNTITLTFKQGWVTHTVNNLKLSLTKDGAIGKKPSSYGSGLTIPGYTGNQIMDAGLMIGTSNTKVSDNCRKGTGTAGDTDFTGLNIYALTKPGVYSNEDGNGLFNDDGAGSLIIGVTVRAKSYAWNTGPDADYIILKYTIKNTSGSALSNLFAGIYTYFTPLGLNTGLTSTLDTANKLGYTYANSNNNPHLGVCILTNQNLNFKAINAGEVFNGFTTQEKWDALSGGISNPSYSGISCFVISAGPININNNDSVNVAFAIVKGNDLNTLKTNAVTAKNKYAVIGVKPISNSIPLVYSLYQNYPNPFNPSTTIKFDIPRQDFVNIGIYDILGRYIGEVLNEKLGAGSYEIKYDAGSLSSGVYFYTIRAGNFSDVKKMVLIK
jgi:subtilisin family serine protease